MPGSSTARLAATTTLIAAPAVAAALGRSSAPAMTLRGSPRWAAPVGPLPFRHPIHRPRLLHLLARTDGIALFQEPGEGRSGALGDLVLKFLGQVGEGDVGMDRLDIAQQLVGQ